MTNEENEVIDSTNDTEQTAEPKEEVVEEEVELDLEDEVKSDEELEKLKKEVETLKAQKEHWRNKASEKKIETSTLTEEAVEMKILKSQGMADELIESLKKVAKVTGKPMLDAQSDSVFIAMKNEYERKLKEEKSSLGASRGSAQVKAKADTNTPGLTEEAHKQLWKSKMGL